MPTERKRRLLVFAKRPLDRKRTLSSSELRPPEILLDKRSAGRLEAQLTPEYRTHLASDPEGFATPSSRALLCAGDSPPAASLAPSKIADNLPRSCARWISYSH